MTRNLKLFLGATVVFYLIGAVNDSMGMYVLAASALAVILACFFLTRLLIRGVRVEVEVPMPRAQAGDEVTFAARVRNAGSIYRSGMTLSLKLVNETVPLASQSAQFALPPLPPRSLTELALPLVCLARGRHRVGEVEVAATDPIGMYRRGSQFPGGATLLALPRINPAPGLSGWELLSPVGRRSARILRRSGGEFDTIRPHVPGDDLRHVHWKVTAHTGELVVRGYRQRREAEVVVWLDLWRPNHPQRRSEQTERATRGISPQLSALHENPTEVAVSLAATLLNMFVHGDYLVSLAGHGLSPDLALPSRGEAYYERALAALAQATPVDGPSFSEFCEERLRYSPRMGTVFAITPAAEPSLPEVLARVAHRSGRVQCFMVGPDPKFHVVTWPLIQSLIVSAFNDQSEDDNELDETPAHLTDDARLEMLQRLQAAGIGVTVVPSFEAIPRALVTATTGLAEAPPKMGT